VQLPIAGIFRGTHGSNLAAVTWADILTDVGMAA
jgi:hypothetical protein